MSKATTNPINIPCPRDFALPGEPCRNVFTLENRGEICRPRIKKASGKKLIPYVVDGDALMAIERMVTHGVPDDDPHLKAARHALKKAKKKVAKLEAEKAALPKPKPLLSDVKASVRGGLFPKLVKGVDTYSLVNLTERDLALLAALTGHCVGSDHISGAIYHALSDHEGLIEIVDNKDGSDVPVLRPVVAAK